MGDMNLGFRWAFWAQRDLVATLQLRGYLPTATRPSLGTDHVSLEPHLWAASHNLLKAIRAQARRAAATPALSLAPAS